MEFDVIVIGAGPGGYPAAIKAAKLGAKTAIIEREWLGGTCLNCGCIPTKTLIAGAETYQKILHADALGIKVGTPTIDYPAMKKRKDTVVSTLQGGIGSLLKAHNVTLFEGAGAFVNEHTIEISKADGSAERIEGKHIIIATGSTSTVPGFIPEGKQIVESRAFLELEKLPKSLLVLGGGYIGCELACMAAGLGVEVTVVELLDDVLMLLDKDVRTVVKKHMKDHLGVTFLTGAPMQDIETTKKGSKRKRVINRSKQRCFSWRSAEASGNRWTKCGSGRRGKNEHGYIEVDELNRTNIEHIYCIGDVSGRMQLAHAATSQAIYAVEHALKEEEKVEEVVIPGVIFTTPEVGLVGLTEEEAKAEGIEISIGKHFFRGLGKALASNETDGFVKIICDKQSDKIIGAQCAGPHATDLISEMVIAIREELTAEELGNTVHGHPTFAEIWMEAAHAVHQACIHAPPAR